MHIVFQLTIDLKPNDRFGVKKTDRAPKEGAACCVSIFVFLYFVVAMRVDLPVAGSITSRLLLKVTVA